MPQSSLPEPPPVAAAADDDDVRVLAQIADLRLSRNWSIRRLAVAMTDAGYPMPYRTLARLLRRPYVTRGCDRSIYRLRRFLEYVYMQAEQKQIRQVEREERDEQRRREARS